MTATEAAEQAEQLTPFQVMRAAAFQAWQEYNTRLEPATARYETALATAAAELDASSRAAYSRYTEAVRNAHAAYNYAADQFANERDQAVTDARDAYLEAQGVERHAQTPGGRRDS